MKRLPRHMAHLEAKRCHRSTRPACKECPIRVFCATWRAKEAERQPKGEPIIDLFCGAGGMSQGFEEAGFVPVLAVDADLDAILTYRANRPWLSEDRAIARDIRELVKEGKFKELAGTVQGVIGGPPCQTFSLVGFRTKKEKHDGKVAEGDHTTWRDDRIHKDPRTWLPTYMADIIAAVQPEFCVMENVAGFMSALGGKVRERTRQAIIEAGYSITEVKVRAERNGAPQYRWRYMLIGLQNKAVGGRRRAEELLREVHDKLESGTATEVSAAEALRKLERFGAVAAGGGAEYVLAADGTETWNHYARAHNKRDLAIYTLLKPGETAAELEARRSGTIPYELVSFKDKYRKLDLNRPSPTIPAHLKRDANSFIVPEVNRGVTPREAATLQGFPMGYVFTGEQTHQFQQIGNAVPPPVAENVARLIRTALHKGKDRKWSPRFVAEHGRRPSKETAVVREYILGCQAKGSLGSFEDVLHWSSRRLQTAKKDLRPMVYREYSRLTKRA
jgi:DNA (cytosine-5)-methyltransferase 1